MLTAKLRKIVYLLALGLVPAAAQADVVTDWNNILLETIRTTNTNPPKASRNMGIVHAAVYDAVNSIDQTHTPYKFSVAASAGASKEAAAVEAAFQTLSALYPANVAALTTQRDASLAAIANGPGKDAGIQIGLNIAQQHVALRTNDGSDTAASYTPGTNPGDWRPTPTGFAAALLPGWGNVTPFAMTSGSQVRLGAPPALNSPEYAAALNKVKDLGASNSATRTPDQTNIALFWADGAGTVTPPGHWNKIAQTAAAAQGNDISENARMFALINIGMADAGIACWDNKYAYNLWRPIAAIREADTDGNDATIADPAWTPLIATPPFPEYTSGHSTFSGAAANILAKFFGTDAIAFSDTNVNGTRSFNSFTQAALEAADSRLFGGIHYEFSNIGGYVAGTQIADIVFSNYMTAVPEPSCIALAFGGSAVLLLRRRNARA